MSWGGADRITDLGSVGVFSAGLWRLQGLKTFLGAERLVFRPGSRYLGQLDSVVGWGHKPSAAPARAFARRHGVPYVALEDGFLRSAQIGAAHAPLSMVLDDLGIYYDARSPSRLESWLAKDDALADVALLERARACRRRIREERLSKYNHTPRQLPERWKKRDRPIVLVADQTYGDAAVTQGLASAGTFERMVEAARDENPHARIVVKVHPATVAGNKRGYLAGASKGVELLADAVNPVALLEQVERVYVVSSQLGFEALMAQKPVRCFGAPFYAGWGLTDDERRLERRGRVRSLDELVAAALLRYPRYRHPVLDERCDAERIIEHLALQRRALEDNARTYYCLGFSTWKRPFVRRYLASGTGGGQVRFLRSARQLRGSDLAEPCAVLVWGHRAKEPRLRGPSGKEVPVWRMEDGFLRSVRLGSQLTPPGSLVLDRSGIYYDPTRPSDLERLLAETRFSPEELERAARLRRQIIDSGVSKYNLTVVERWRPRSPSGRQVVLVVGQVQDDASVRLGSPLVRSNHALLCAARRMRPGAHLVYKPHPDVLSGNRHGELVRDEPGLWDELVTDASIAACLDAVDEVHTMTSLVGFEALLRGVTVVVHGLPFYAGWGLTEDRLPAARRGRRLGLDELVAGTLIRYPRYYSWQAKAFCTAEETVAELARMRRELPRWPLATPWLIRRLRDVAILSWEWLHA